MSDDNESARYDKRIHALVSESQKKEWKTTAQQSEEYESLSHLVRLAVTRELATSNPARSGDGEIPEGLQQTLSDMATTLSSMESRIQSVETRLNTLEVESGDDALNLQQRILQALPTPPEGEETPIGERITSEQTQIHKWAVSPPEIASKVGGEVETVEKSLEQLAEETGTVQARTGGEPTRTWYFRRG